MLLFVCSDYLCNVRHYIKEITGGEKHDSVKSTVIIFSEKY